MLTDLDDDILENTEDILQLSTSMLKGLGWYKDGNANFDNDRITIFTHPDVNNEPYRIIRFLKNDDNEKFVFTRIDGIGITQSLHNYKELKQVTDSLLI